MVTLIKDPVVYKDLSLVPAGDGARSAGVKKTITYGILAAHNTSGNDELLELKFDSLSSHDITYVGIIQSARASGMKAFPLPYVMTNCHNSLCAVGGTINEDDHRFALSAARKYGGIYVPPHLAVIHSYNREMTAGCGKMILGSDSHTRYGALGTLGVGEGGGELTKQLLSRAYDIAYPEVIAVELSGAPRAGTGPHDVALSIIKEVFAKGFVQNKVMEFIGSGIKNLSQDYRNAIDVMTTETACWSSVWRTDEITRQWLKAVGREGDYRELSPSDGAYYSGAIKFDLSKIEPCIALPFHPSNVYTIKDFKANAACILKEVQKEAASLFGEAGARLPLIDKLKNGEFYVDQAIIAGCSGGTPGNIAAAAKILDGKTSANIENGFSLSVYPDSQAANSLLLKNGVIEKLVGAGAVTHTAFCGPCFGAGDTPANGAFSIRHTTRNFPNREGSKPNEGQVSLTALVDARSIAATALNGGKLSSAFELSEQGYDVSEPDTRFSFDASIYEKRVFSGWGKAAPDALLVLGPNIKDWPEIPAMKDHIALKVVSFITDDVTTTDELIPSGETSSFRSNPLRLAEFTLSRRDPGYVERAKETAGADCKAKILSQIALCFPSNLYPASSIQIQSALYARKPGDGSAREQAASCQRVLGGGANFALEYATKRYRSNLINWGLLPFLLEKESDIENGCVVFVPNIKKAVLENAAAISAYRIDGESASPITLKLGGLNETERDILKSGCLINYYKAFS